MEVGINLLLYVMWPVWRCAGVEPASVRPCSPLSARLAMGRVLTATIDLPVQTFSLKPHVEYFNNLGGFSPPSLHINQPLHSQHKAGELAYY